MDGNSHQKKYIRQTFICSTSSAEARTWSASSVA
jgi:hypothetical protein